MGATCSTHWKDDFSVIKDDDPRQPVLLQHHHTNQQYQLITVPLADSQLIHNFKTALKKREKFESPNVQKLHTVYHQQANEYCGNSQRYDLVFEAETVTLDALYRYRQQHRQPFTHHQIEYIIRQVCLGLKDLKNIQEEHGDVTLKTILVNKTVKLRDPTAIRNLHGQPVSNAPPRKVRGYPSPQKLYKLFDALSSFDEFTSDLYSVGLIGLQLAHLQTNIKDTVYTGGHPHYYNSRINQQNLQMLSFMVEGQPLKDWISTLLNQEPGKRLNIFEKIEGYAVEDRQLRELRNNPLMIRKEEELIQPIKTVEQMQQYNYNSQPQIQPLIKTPDVPVATTGQTADYGWAKIKGPQNNIQSNPPVSAAPNMPYHAPSVFQPPSFKLQQPTLIPPPSLPSLHTNNYYTSSFSPIEPYRVNSTPISTISTTQPFALPKFDFNPSAPSTQLPLPSLNLNPPTLIDPVKPTSREPIISIKPTSPQPRRNRLLDKPPATSTLPTPITERSEKSSHVEDSEFVIEQYEIGTRYEGFKSNGKRNGLGKFFYSEGSCYDGQWKDNRMNGYGILTYPNGAKAYEGYWKDDQFDGTGTIFNDSQVPLDSPFDYTDFNKLDDYWVSYEGEIKDGKKNGVGKMLLTNGESYSGRFVNDEMEGEGIYSRSNGGKVKGLWSDSRLRRTYT